MLADMPTVNSGEWLTTAQAAERLRLTPVRVRALERAGRLPAAWTPLGRLFSVDVVDRFLAERGRAERRG